MSDKARTFVGGCLIVLVGALTFANGLSGPMQSDDLSAIARNDQIRHLWPPTEALAPEQRTGLASRPLVNLSLAINYAASGLAVRGYHIVNVTVHLVSALLLFGIIRLTLRTSRLRGRFDGTADGIALASALIWMVHPLQTESVDYIVQRTELMMGLFYLLTLYSAIRAATSSAPEQWRTVAIVSCLLGMGCKESMVTAPLMVALYDRTFLFDSMADAWRRRRSLYAGLALGWFALAAMLITTRSPTVTFGASVSGWTYLLNQCLMIVRYLQLTVWPHGLVVDYGMPRQLVLADVWPQAAALAALAVLTAIALVSRPIVGFLGAWFFITLAPASSVVPILTEVGAERRMYLPLAALVVFAVVGASRLLALAGVSGRRMVQTAVVSGALVVAVLAYATVQRNHDYASAVSLLQTTVDRWPHGRSHFNLGGALAAEGRFDEAAVQLRAAVPEQPRALFELGSELHDQGRYHEAIKELRAFLARIGTNTRTADQRVLAHNLIALSLAQQGKLSEAVEEFRAALQLDPDNPDLHGNLAFILLRLKNFAGVREHYEAFLLHHQGNAFVLTNLGIALQELGHLDEANARFRQALALDPHYGEAQRRLEQAVAVRP